MAHWQVQIMKIFTILFQKNSKFAKKRTSIQPGQPIFELKNLTDQVAFDYSIMHFLTAFRSYYTWKVTKQLQ